MSSPDRTQRRHAAIRKGILAIVVLTFVVLVAQRIARYANVEPDRQSMPAAMTDEAERQLFQTPEGMYTLSDIAANGDQLPSGRYRGFRAAHDFQPAPGDRLCPVTRTRGNPECTWIVGGQTYEFCCPPCIAEFVHKAKRNPENILPAEAYVEGNL